MNVPILTRRQEARQKNVEDRAIKLALKALADTVGGSGTIEKAFLTGNAASMGSLGASAAGQLATVSNTGGPGVNGQQNSLVARVSQNLADGFNKAPEELEAALAEQGLSWGPPFPPGRPLDPFFGVGRPPRTWDYSVGENVQLTPRWNRVSFPTIKSIYEAYDVAQICVRHLINDVRSLDYNWEPIPGIQADVSGDIEEAIKFFDSPDKRQPFRAWLAEYLQDVLRYDAGTLYTRRNNAGEAIAWEVVDGTTMIPLVDFYGRRPEDEDDEHADSEGVFEGTTVPAFVQIIEGLPWDWLSSEDITYQPWNPLPDSQYGLAPLEAVLLSANTDIRFQWHFLQFFTEGSIPGGFMEAPPEMSDPAQVAQWQEAWDSIMIGDQTKSRQIRWVPANAKYTASKPDADKFNPDFVLYLARRTMASFGVTPNDLGFTEDVNRATGDTQVDVQFRVGTSPLLRHVEDVINLFTKQTLGLRCRIRFDDGRETEDRVATAQADGIYIDHGVKGVDECRQELGLPIDKTRPIARYINNARSGPIPLLALESMAGEIDAETYGPAEAQPPVATPFVAPPGPLPPQGSPEQKAAAETTAQMARNLIKTTTGETSEEEATETEEAEPPAAEGEEETTKSVTWQEIFSLLDTLEKGADNAGGPGISPGATKATTVTGGTDGITTQTGIQGSGLEDDEDDDEDDAIKSAYVALSLRRWRDNSRNRLRKGRAPRRFVDPNLPDEIHAEIWAKLNKATTREEVDAAFTDVGKASAGDSPAFHSQADAIVRHYAPALTTAISGAVSTATIEAAITAAAAATEVKKYTGPPPNLRDAETDLKSCKNCCLFNHPLCVKYGNWPVRLDQTCDGWQLSIDDQATKEAEPNPARDAALASLQSDGLSLAAAQKTLVELYGDSFLQGAHDAAIASGGTVVASLKDATMAPSEAYWNTWKPGYGDAAAKAADGGMRDMLDAVDQTITGLSDTTIDRLGNAIAEGLSSGDSVQSMAREVRDMLDDPARAEMIVNTEYARAMTQASLETYAQNGVEQLMWFAEADACPECEENADASPVAASDGFPNGDVPVHPNCRCAIGPAEEAESTTEN